MLEKLADMNFLSLIMSFVDDTKIAEKISKFYSRSSKGGKTKAEKQTSLKNDRKGRFLEFYQDETDSQPRFKET